MKIAIDGFGGDNAPDEVIKGAVAAVQEYGVDLLLTGDEKTLTSRFAELSLSQNKIQIVHADSVIRVEDNPLDIRTSKANSSMGVALCLLKDGKADAVVSAGSTAALTVGGTTLVGRIKGVKRPALSPIFPATEGRYMLLDVGANIECRPEMLLQFGVMGSVYMNKVAGVANPRVGLLNIGTEPEKGRELELAAYGLLSASGLNFIGNVEARDVPLGACDVLVTDGFTGNVYLKAVEGMGKFMKHSLKQLFGKNVSTKLGYLLAKSGVTAVSKQNDYREVGGSPLLGTAKPVIKAHGSSDAKAFKNAIRQARDSVTADVTEAIAAKLKEVKES